MNPARLPAFARYHQGLSAVAVQPSSAPRERAKTALNQVLPILGWASIVLYFFRYAAHAIHAHFSPDEMMNMAWAWEAGLPKILKALAEFWTSFYRPTGELYYLALYHLFGLHSIPFRAVDLAVLVLNLALAYRLVYVLTRSHFVAWLSTLLFSYQAKISIWTVYNGAWAYDRLCFTFFVSALLVYVAGRQQNRVVSGTRCLAVVLLYIFALGAKEMAVAFPVVLFAYELIWHSPAPGCKPVLVWLRRDTRLIWIVAAMTLAYIIGKNTGPGALSNIAVYRPHDFTIAHYLDSQGSYINEFIFRMETCQPRPPVLWIFATVAVLAACFLDGTLALAAVWALVTPLPLAFIHRTGGALYIVYLGWTLIAALIVYRAGLLLGSRFRAGWRYLPVILMTAVGLFFFDKSNRLHQHFGEPAMLSFGDLTWSVINQFNRVHPSLPHHSTVVFLHTPFTGFDLRFITELWSNDHTLNIVLNEATPLTANQLAKANVVLTFDRDNRLQQIR